MGYLLVDFCRADDEIVAHIPGVTAVRGPYRNAKPLAGILENPIRQENKRFEGYDVMRNTEGGWHFVQHIRDCRDEILDTKVKTTRETFDEARMDLEKFLKKERKPGRLLQRIFADGTFNQKSMGNVIGEVSLPAVRRAIEGQLNPLVH